MEDLSKPRVIARYDETGYSVLLMDEEGTKTIMERGNDRNHPTARATKKGDRIPVTLLRRYAQTQVKLEAQRLGARAGYTIKRGTR